MSGEQCEGCGRRFDVQYAAGIDKWLCWNCLIDSDGFAEDDDEREYEPSEKGNPMTNQQPTDLEQLRAILAKMTPGEWNSRSLPLLSSGVFVAACGGHDDSDGIVAIHNAMPSLLDEVAALRREVERLRQRLRESDALMEMWTCPICDCTIRKVHMELCDGTPAPCPECGRIAAEEMVRLMRNALKLCIAIRTEVVWTTVGDADVDGYIEQAKAKGQ